MDTCCALCIVSFLSKDIEVNNENIENMEDNSWLHSQTCQALLEQTPTSYIQLRALHYTPAMVVSYLPGDVGNSASMIVRGHTQAQHEIRAEMA